MADPRFFTVPEPVALSELADIANAELVDGSPDQLMHDVKSLASAGASDVSFLDNRKYIDQFVESRAGACVAHPDMAERAPKSMALLLTEQPYLGYARIAQRFYPGAALAAEPGEPASLAPSASIGAGVIIAAGAVIGDRAEIGDRCQIGAGAVVGAGCVLGADTRVGANVTLSHSIVGERVTIFPGSSIGQDGFGFAPSPTGAIRVPQLGRVVIGDDVEIGANTTIDRGAGPDTIIGTGTMIDNLVQIGHNVVIGMHCVVVSQVGISGSTEIGNGVMIGGQAGFAGHIRIGDGAKVAAKAGVFRDVLPGETVGGFPAKPAKQWWREQAFLEKQTKKGK